MPPGQTKTPPGLTHFPTHAGGSTPPSTAHQGAGFPLGVLMGSTGLFFVVQATSWRQRR
ncbi:MAG: hypothetical protein JXD18_05015 [Anaerolineae bacterium]|nr:hypothetical protein [Anaerolineae bacterium]